MTQANTPAADYDQFCREVGKLILGFGNLENTLSICLKWHLRDAMIILKPNHAASLSSAVYGSMRFKSSRDTIKRILKAERAGDQLAAFLAGAFVQMAHIEELRDKIAHQAVIEPRESHSGQWEAWDVFTTRDPENDRVWSFSLDAVAMAADDSHAFVERISTYLDVHRENVNSTLFGNLDVSPIAWRYKPSTLKLLPRSKRRGPRSPKPQPRSSRG